MLNLDEAQARIEARVPVLAGRVLRAGDFNQLIEQDGAPAMTPCAYLLPGGMTGGPVLSSSGLFIQGVDDTLLCVVAVEFAGDGSGSAAADAATPIATDVITALCGWAPTNDCPGVFALSRAELSGSRGGLALFQIDFTIADQLRIVP